MRSGRATSLTPAGAASEPREVLGSSYELQTLDDAPIQFNQFLFGQLRTASKDRGTCLPREGAPCWKLSPRAPWIIRIWISTAIGYLVLSPGTKIKSRHRAVRRIASWGGNGVGQLGDGTQTDRLTPVRVKDPSDQTGFLRNVKAVAAGSGFSLALKDDGTVWAWGSNAEAQLGDGTTNTIPRLSPGKVTDPSDPTGFMIHVAHGRHPARTLAAAFAVEQVWRKLALLVEERERGESNPQVGCVHCGIVSAWNVGSTAGSRLF